METILVCSNCKSTDFEILAWIDANTNEYKGEFTGEGQDCYCNSCSGHHASEVISIPNLKLFINSESVNIYIDNGDSEEPTHFVYWHEDEWKEDSSITMSIVNAVHLFHTDPIKLFTKIKKV